jgi:hypothetical protein
MKRNYCVKCGAIIKKPRKKYCPNCAVVVDKEGNRIRGKRYREKNGNEKVKKWVKEHSEEHRLYSRNWAQIHKEERRLALQNWRKQNPAKVKMQNRRAKKKIRHNKLRTLSSNGIYKKFKWTIVCPKCNLHFKTTAKRPQCSCGYSFPRRFMERFIDTFPTKPCKTCGREIPYPGEGTIRKYCETCFPQMTALYKAFHPNKHSWREWYQENKEVLVAMTCRACGNLIIYKGIGKIPQKCGLCKGIERSRPKPIWNPKDIKTFIYVEKHRLGLHKKKKWDGKEVRKFYEYWDKREIFDSTYLGVTNED